MIFTSSYVYGVPKYLPIDEIHPINPFNPYAQSKLIGEELCSGYNRDFNVPIIIFRPFNIYGKSQCEHFLIPKIIKQAKQGKIQLEDSRPKRDFIYIDDVIDAYEKAIYYKKTPFEIFNLGTGKSTSINDLSKTIANKINKKISISFSEKKRKNEVLDTIANIDKAYSYLKWKPKFNKLNIILETSIKWEKKLSKNY